MAVASEYTYFSDREPSRKFDNEKEAQVYDGVLYVAEFIAEQCTLDFEDAKALATEMNRNGLLRLK